MGEDEMKTGLYFMFLIAFAATIWLGKSGGRILGIASGQAAAISVEATEINVGSLSLHQSATAVFRITNMGNRHLRIDRVMPECGCLRVDTFDADIPPGICRSIPVMVTLSQAVTAPFRKELLLVIDDDRIANIPLYVSGNCVGIRDVAIFPAHLAFGDTRAGVILHKSIYALGDPAVLSSMPLNIELAAPLGSDTLLVLNDCQNVQSTQVATEIKIELKINNSVRSGAYRSSLNLEGHGKSAIRLSIPITFTVKE